MTIDFSKLRFSTKGLIAFLLALGSFMQIPQVLGPVLAFVAHHPHWAVAFGMFTGVVGLLHNPQVEVLLGINQTVTKDAATGDTKTVTEVVVPVSTGGSANETKKQD